MRDNDNISAQAEAAGAGDLVRALGAPAQPTELAGRDRALHAFRQEMLAPARDPRQMWRPAMTPTVLRFKLGATAAGFVVGLTAAGVAALGLTSPQFQNASQDSAVPVATTTTVATSTETASATTDAEESTATETEATETEAPETEAAGTEGDESESEGSGEGPDATGPAAFGLCTAWSNHERNGAEPTGSVAFRNLAEAAGGEDEIEDYCESIEHPSDKDKAEGGDEQGETDDDAIKPSTSKGKSPKGDKHSSGTKGAGKKSAKHAG